jgi:hypothetical protein
LLGTTMSNPEMLTEYTTINSFEIKNLLFDRNGK